VYAYAIRGKRVLPAVTTRRDRNAFVIIYLSAVEDIFRRAFDLQRVYTLRVIVRLRDALLRVRVQSEIDSFRKTKRTRRDQSRISAIDKRYPTREAQKRFENISDPFALQAAFAKRRCKFSTDTHQTKLCTHAHVHSVKTGLPRVYGLLLLPLPRPVTRARAR